MIINTTSELNRLELNFANERYCIRLNAQKRRSFRLQINARYELELLMPKLGKYQLKAFLHNHETWLLEQIKLRLKERQALMTVYCFQGVAKPVKTHLAHALEEQADALYVPETWSLEMRLKNIEAYKREQAYQLATSRLDYWWPKFAYALNSPTLRIKKMKTRWGSMSSKHNLNLSLELFAYPLAQIDLVLVHELCHIQYMNHSPDFYALMQSKLPDWKIREEPLKQRPYE